MDVIFGTVLDIASVVFGDVRRGERVVVDGALDRVIAFAVIGKGLEKRGAAGTRTPEDH